MTKEEIRRHAKLLRRLLRHMDATYDTCKSGDIYDEFHIFTKNNLDRLSFETRERGLDYTGEKFRFIHTPKEERPSNIIKNLMKHYKSISYQHFEPASFKDMSHYNFYERQFKTTKTFELPETLDEFEMKLDIIGV